MSEEGGDACCRHTGGSRRAYCWKQEEGEEEDSWYDEGSGHGDGVSAFLLFFSLIRGFYFFIFFFLKTKTIFFFHGSKKAQCHLMLMMNLMIYI